jgi:hypothetical protein
MDWLSLAGPSVSDETIWSSFARTAVQTADPLIGVKLDLEKITSLFAKMVMPGAKSGNACGAVTKVSTSPAPKARPTILSQQRATNIGITFTKLKVICLESTVTM